MSESNHPDARMRMTLKHQQLVPLSLKVTPQMKQHIDRLAIETGQTQSQVVEAMIERAFAFEAMLQTSEKNGSK
jgi:predicted transcriptional regulator